MPAASRVCEATSAPGASSRPAAQALGLLVSAEPPEDAASRGRRTTALPRRPCCSRSSHIRSRWTRQLRVAGVQLDVGLSGPADRIVLDAEKPAHPLGCVGGERPRLVDAAEHGKERCPGDASPRVPDLGRECVQCRERLVGRAGAVDERQVEPEQARAVLPRELGMAERLLGGEGVVGHPGPEVRHVEERVPHVHEGGMVTGRLQQLERSSGKPFELVGVRRPGQWKAMLLCLHPGQDRPGLVPRRSRSVGGGLRGFGGAQSRPGGMRLDQVELEGHVLAGRGVNASARSIRPIAAMKSSRQSARRPAAARCAPARAARSSARSPSSRR